MRAFIIFRDRVTYAKQTVKAFEDAGLDVAIIDHGTTWEPAREWLHEQERDGRIIITRNHDCHPRSIWDDVRFRVVCGDHERYIVSDPDTPPAPDCPSDWVQRLEYAMDLTEMDKIGLSLRISDIPEHYPLRQKVLDWERQYWESAMPYRGIWASAVDTTIAMYSPLSLKPFPGVGGFRLDEPYTALHLPWYEDPDNLPDDVRYYQENIHPTFSFWTVTGGRNVWDTGEQQ